MTTRPTDPLSTDEQVSLEEYRRVLKKNLYEIWLDLGGVFHALSNHDDAGEGAELLEPVMERLQELWQ